MRRLIFLILLLVGVSGFAYADQTASRADIVNSNEGWLTQPDRNEVLLIRTTDVALNQAFSDLSVPFDEYVGDNFSGVDLTGYTHVFVAMDGGLVEDPSIQNVATFAGNGGHVHFYGGTCWQGYAIALNAHLLLNDVNNYCWSTVGGSPDVLVVDPAHCLADALPGTYNFVDPAATFYSTRSTDPGTAVAAINGDNYDMLMSKAIGAGTFDICINSPYVSYYMNPTDYNWLKQVVQNMLNCVVPVPVENTTWGNIKALYR